MFRRRGYHHGHSIGVGVLLGLLLTRHGFALACCSLAAGVILGRTWAWWATKAAVLGMAVRTAARDRRPGLVGVYSTRAKARGARADSEIPF